MKTIVDQINKEISAKCATLKNRLIDNFVQINGAITINNKVSDFPVTRQSIPPICYIFLLLSIVSIICIFATEEHLIWTIIAIFFLFMAYRFYRYKGKASHSTSNQGAAPSFSVVKESLKPKIVSLVKGLSNDWGEFMSAKQEEILSAIDSKCMEPDEKDKMQSKVYAYEVIDVSLLDLLEIIDSASDINEIRVKLNSIQAMMLQAIDATCRKQIEKYQSLLEC